MKNTKTVLWCCLEHSLPKILSFLFFCGDDFFVRCCKRMQPSVRIFACVAKNSEIFLAFLFFVPVLSQSVCYDKFVR